LLRPKFEVSDFAELLASPDAAISLVSLVPTMLLRLLDAGLSDPPTLRRAVVSGAPLTSDLKLRALDAGIPVVEAWGMTETTGLAAVERQPGQGGAGPALDGIHIELSESGEIRVGGPTVAPGVMVGAMFNTGDLGSLDGGVLRVTGRASSLIISGGQNVSPERVEDVLSAHPAVEACRVFGVDSSEWGQSVAAEIVVSGDPSDAELRAHCADRMAVWETPRTFIRVAELEMTASGKPTRHPKETS
jgi:O-succinylbenzoic acid--CoA ligase